MKLFVTQRAEKNFDLIIAYIQQKWGEKTTKEFILKVDQIFKLLKLHPLMGNIEIKDIRGFQLTRQSRILYRVSNNKIIIISFLDVRKDPKKRFK